MIKEFQGEYRWLSNFWPVTIFFKERRFSSVEHAYMSEKNDAEVWKDFCTNEKDHKIVKKMSDIISLRPNWEEVKIGIMKELVRLKFQNPELRKKLLATGDTYLQEGNDWGDTFWGVDLETGKGENMLGKIIMDVRDELRNSDS